VVVSIIFQIPKSDLKKYPLAVGTDCLDIEHVQKECRCSGSIMCAIFNLNAWCARSFVVPRSNQNLTLLLPSLFIT